MQGLSRRGMMLGAAVLAANPALAVVPPDRRLAFAVFRNGTKVGEHEMSFSGPEGAVNVATDVTMTIKLGPVPVYRYRHRATERWEGGRFASLETTTDGNGKIEKVSARRTAGGVIIEGDKGRIVGPASSLPLTHWNSDCFAGPMFNPQVGAMLKLTARRVGQETVKTADGSSLQATRWSLRGESQIDDWYDAQGVWAALRGKLPDGSTMEYRRL